MNNKEHAKRNILRFVNKKKRNAENEKYIYIYRKKNITCVKLTFVYLRSHKKIYGQRYRGRVSFNIRVPILHHYTIHPSRSYATTIQSISFFFPFFERNVGTRETMLTRKIHRNIISSHRTNVSDDSCVDRAGNVSLFQLPGTLSRPFTLYEATVKAILFLRVTERNNR